jgi:hypothetical protein
MQPAIQLAPSHLLRNIDTSSTVRLPLFLSIPSKFSLAVLFLLCTQKVHPSFLGRNTNYTQVSLWPVQITQECPVTKPRITNVSFDVNFNRLFTNYCLVYSTKCDKIQRHLKNNK